ncbi:hypothetical protein Bca4012_052935 [Brassica carinata]
MFSGARDAFSRRRWLLVATSLSTCISILSFRSSSRVLCCSRSRYLSIGALMVSSRPKVSSTPLFYGDSRSVNLCRSFTRRLTLYRPPHRGLRSVSSNRRSVFFILPLSMSLQLEDPHRRSPSISSQAHSQTTTSDVLTVVSGIPYKTRFLDPKLFQFRVMGSPSLISLTTVAGHSREIEETFSTDDTAAAFLPQALHSSITFGDLMYCIGGVPLFSWPSDLKTKQCIRLSSLHNAPSISVPTIPFRSASFLVAALGLKSDSSHPPLQASRAPARNRKIFHHQGVPPSGATLSAVPVTRIPPNSAASHRASSASLFQQGHNSTFLKLGLQILNLGLVSPIAFNYKWSSPLLSQPTVLWGFLISLINCLKTSDGFNGVFTEADLHTTPYFSCAKSLLSNHLPVGSPGSPSPPLASVLVKKRTVLSNTSLLKSVSLPNIKWKCPSISITDLLSCGAVRSGPEDAADFVSTILRGADWVLTSPFHVTIFQLSNCVVKALSTHLSLVLNSMSSSHEELSILSAFDIVVYLFNQRGWYFLSCYCNQNN